jgi:hypothetical protein
LDNVFTLFILGGVFDRGIVHSRTDNDDNQQNVEENCLATHGGLLED